MIRKNNEEEILRAFESMLRKKIKKSATKSGTSNTTTIRQN